MGSRLLIALLIAIAGAMLAANRVEAQMYTAYANGIVAVEFEPPVEVLDVHVDGGVGSWGVSSGRSLQGSLESRSYCENPLSGLYTPQVQSGGYGSLEAWDVVVTGPAGAVPVTFHFVLEGRLGITGTYPYAASVRIMGSVPGAEGYFEGSVALDGSGLLPTGVLAGVPGPEFSIPIDVSGSLLADSPDFLYLLLETGAGGTAIGLDVNTASADFMSDFDGDGIGGFHPATAGPAVTVPAGYSLSSAALGIVDNHWVSAATTSVGEPAPSSWGRVKTMYR